MYLLWKIHSLEWIYCPFQKKKYFLGSILHSNADYKNHLFKQFHWVIDEVINRGRRIRYIGFPQFENWHVLYIMKIGKKISISYFWVPLSGRTLDMNPNVSNFEVWNRIRFQLEFDIDIEFSNIFGGKIVIFMSKASRSSFISLSLWLW